MTTSDTESGIIDALRRLHVAIADYFVLIETPDYEQAEATCLLDACDAIELEIAAIPSVTVEDFAIKAYLALRAQLGEYGDTILRIDFEGSQRSDQTAIRSVASDALRFSPTLAAMVQQPTVQGLA